MPQISYPVRANAKYTVVNFGCGPYPSPDCINLDGSPTVLLAKLPLPASAFGKRAEFVRVVREHRVQYGLATKLSFPPNSLDAFYTSHTLEHLPPRQCKLLLERVLVWLKPSGILRVALPDLKKLAAEYVADQIDANEFVARTHLAKGDLPPWVFVISHARHQHMYDSESFHTLLCSVGYQHVAASPFRESRIRDIESLDLDCRRWDSFYVEAVK